MDSLVFLYRVLICYKYNIVENKGVLQRRNSLAKCLFLCSTAKRLEIEGSCYCEAFRITRTHRYGE